MPIVSGGTPATAQETRRPSGRRPSSSAIRVYATKTGRARSVRLLKPLAADLSRWRLVAGSPKPDALVFPTADGDGWKPDDWRDWRQRIYHPAAQTAGLEDTRPYNLRHSFVSLLVYEGHSVGEVARQAGHSPQTCMNTYMHVFEEFDPAKRITAGDRIRAARRKKRPRAS